MVYSIISKAKMARQLQPCYCIQDYAIEGYCKPVTTMNAVVGVWETSLTVTCDLIAQQLVCSIIDYRKYSRIPSYF